MILVDGQAGPCWVGAWVGCMGVWVAAWVVVMWWGGLKSQSCPTSTIRTGYTLLLLLLDFHGSRPNENTFSNYFKTDETTLLNFSLFI